MAGIRFIRTPGSGEFRRRLVLKEGNSATQNFRVSGDNTLNFRNSSVPKPKFLFFVRFNSHFTAETLPTGLVDSYRLKDPKDKNGLVFQLKAIDRPKIQPNVEVLNQYNKKRIIQTKVDYQSTTLRFHDDIADNVMKFWADYFAYYYGDGFKNNTSDWRYDITTGDYEEAGGWGYRGRFPGGSSANQHYLESIDILTFFGGESTTMTFVNPIITMMDHDEADYAEGTTGSGIVMQFDYEGVLYDLARADLTEQESSTFGFSEDYYDPEDNGAFNNVLSGRSTGNLGNTLYKPNSGNNNPYRGLKPRTAKPPTGTDIIKNSLLRTARLYAERGTPISQGLAISFGSEIGKVNPLAGQAVGLAPTILSDASAQQKIYGVTSTMNSYGRFNTPPGGSSITGLPQSVNTGNSAANLANAASVMSTIAGAVANSRTQSGNVSTTRRNGDDFGSTYGAASNVITTQGLITHSAQTQAQLSEEGQAADAVVTKLPNGQFALTDKGASAMNSLRAPISAVGTRQQTNPWKNPQENNNNTRALNIEKGNVRR